MKRLPKGQKAQVMGTRTFQTMYTSEQMRKFAAREWVGLTEDERAEIRREHYARPLSLMDAVEAKLKEKNA